MKLNISETYKQVSDYGLHKAEEVIWKNFILGIMGGLFVALGYLGAITVKASMSSGAESVLATFAAGAIFPTGIILCVFLGGNLFTSDSLSGIVLFKKQITISRAILAWGVVLAGNLVGGLFCAFIAKYAHFFNSYAYANVLQHYVESKQSLVWYASFFSGILCNLLVAGSIWIAHGSHNAGAKIALLWFPIALFAMAGFQHIVANFFIFWSGVLNNGETYKDGALAVKININVGEFIYSNLIPTMFGNLVAGAILLPVPYYLVNKNNDPQNIEQNFK